MGSLDMGRKNYESKEVKETKKKPTEYKSLKEEIDRILGEYQDVDSEIEEAVKKVKSDMDMEWIKEHEVSEGEINLTSPTKDKEQEEELDDIMDVLRGVKRGDTMKLADLPITDLSEDNKISKQEEPVKEEINMKPLEFAEYAGELMEKYHADDYHRMMTEEEINKYANLYSEAFNVDRREALDTIKDTIAKQLNREKTEDEIKKQGLEQDTLMNLGIEYRDKYGSNFMAYLNDEELEKYTVQYLHAYDRKRSDVDKMYQDSLDRAYNEKLEPLNESLSGLTYGKVEGDRMNDNNREKVNEELRKMTQGLSKEQMSPFYDTSYTEVGGSILPSNVSKQALEEEKNESLSGLTYGKVEGDRMNDNDRERVNEELGKMTQGLSKEQMSPFYDTSYTEVGGSILPSNVSEQALEEEKNESLSGLIYGKAEGDRMNDNDREKVNEELGKMAQGLSKEQMSPFYDTSYTEVGGSILPSNVSEQVDQMIEAMANNKVDTNGNPIVEDQNENTNNKQMGYIKIGILSIMSIAVSMGILVLGVMIGG